MNLIEQGAVRGVLDKIQHIDDWVKFLEYLNHHFNIQLSQLLAVDLEVQALSFSIHHSLNIDADHLNQVALTNIRLEIDDDPRLKKSLSAPFQGWMHDSQHFTEQEINQTQVYQQVLQPLNIQFGSAIQLVYDQKICVILALLPSPDRGVLSDAELQPLYDMTLSYAQRTKIMIFDHDLFLTLDLLLPEKAHKIFGLRPVVLATFSGIKQKAKYQRELYTQLFMFTPVEHKICEQLLNASSPKEISQTLDIKPDTVRKHLQSIFTKTRTHRQSELVQLFMKFL
ncbi:LuxR C-terminal-related transcriptional regulator [Acinetobacter sp. VNK23]|uniref:helix-turn-helix transcriptional regulator n=1 Tax=Acinetobacter thutiue TaxID=2998078 RepID=UPI002578EEF9|nr:LuxR C-terminal-related transcriptional regulator [Acinetobacter thutiue]MDM1019569.1 LuxR C-terminal-related transcriptional regulator [Acinetobacter thutiue]